MGVALLACLAALGSCSDLPTAVPPDTAVDLSGPWEVSNPDAAGMDGSRLYVAGELGSRIDRLRSLVVARHGRLVYERYYGGFAVDSLADVRSVTKSLVSTLTGIAIARGDLAGVDQPVAAYLRRPRFDIRPEHAGITIGHLLTMTSGIEWNESGTLAYQDWVTSTDPLAYLLERPVTYEPGARFQYNSAAVHLLGVVLEEATDMSLPDYAARFLLGPLGITRSAWEPSTGGRVNGGSGLDLRPRDLARIGLLMLQDGWSGHRSLVPTAWIDGATTSHVGGLGRRGPVPRLAYGYLWWIDVERNAFFAWGFGGQFLYVDRDLDLVVVATTDWRGVTEDVGNERLQDEVLGIVVDRVVPSVR